MTKKAQILKLLADGKTPKEVAQKMKVTVQRVYATRYEAKKKSAQPDAGFKRVAKKRGRPAKTNHHQQLLSKVILEDRVESLNIEIANLKHQIIGFRAVISYLEDLAGVRDSQ